MVCKTMLETPEAPTTLPIISNEILGIFKQYFVHWLLYYYIFTHQYSILNKFKNMWHSSRDFTIKSCLPCRWSSSLSKCQKRFPSPSMTSNLSKFLYIMFHAYLLQPLILGAFRIFAAWQPARFLLLLQKCLEIVVQMCLFASGATLLVTFV